MYLLDGTIGCLRSSLKLVDIGKPLCLQVASPDVAAYASIAWTFCCVRPGWQVDLPPGRTALLEVNIVFPVSCSALGLTVSMFAKNSDMS